MLVDTGGIKIQILYCMMIFNLEYNNTPTMRTIKKWFSEWQSHNSVYRTSNNLDIFRAKACTHRDKTGGIFTLNK